MTRIRRKKVFLALFEDSILQIGNRIEVKDLRRPVFFPQAIRTISKPAIGIFIGEATEVCVWHDLKRPILPVGGSIRFKIKKAPSIVFN